MGALMIKHTSKTKFTGSLMLGALTAGALVATAGLGSAPTANATCVSAFGLGSGGDCTSNLTSIAIALGNGATAHADGLFGAAFSGGNGTTAVTGYGGGGLFNVAVALGGVNTIAHSGGVLSVSASVSDGSLSIATAGLAPGNLANIALSLPINSTGTALASGVANLAVNFLFNGGIAAGGTGNVGLAAFGQGQGQAEGNFNNATMLFTNGNSSLADVGPSSTLGWAFNIFSTNSKVSAGPGPLAIAGSISQTGATVQKQGPGFNINGFAVGGAAAVHPPSTRITKPAAAARTTASRASASGTKAAKK
jgi:hypothetical protein